MRSDERSTRRDERSARRLEGEAKTMSDAIKRKLTIFFLGNSESFFTNEEHIWCVGDNSISISNRYTGELMFLYPYHTIRKLQQETIR